MNNRLIQAYRQAPWRVQLQWVGVFLLGLILVASVAGIYLNISTRTAEVGRNIQQLENLSDETERNIADLQTQLASLTSAAEMEKRAGELGFQPVQLDTAVYLTVPAYYDRQPAVLAPPPGPSLAAPPILQPNYTESLWDLFFQGFLNNQQVLGGTQP